MFLRLFSSFTAHLYNLNKNTFHGVIELPKVSQVISCKYRDSGHCDRTSLYGWVYQYDGLDNQTVKSSCIPGIMREDAIENMVVFDTLRNAFCGSVS